MKSSCFVVFILVLLFVQYSTQTPPPNTTPSDWTQGVYPAACDAIGATKAIQDPASVVPLTTPIYLKSSYVYNHFTDNDGNDVYIQNIFKYYITFQNQDGVQTILQIALISGNDGTNISQTYTIQGTYEFIDANGPYVLLKQTDGSGAVSLSLYSFDSTQGATNLQQLNSIPISTFPNQVFQSVQVNLVTEGWQNFLNDGNFDGIVGTVVSRNTATTTVVVRQILANGLDTQVYSFALFDIASDIYTNLLLGLQVDTHNFYTYVNPGFSVGSSPFVYAQDTNAITTSSGLFNNHIVLTFLTSMMVATFDDNRQSGNIFFLWSDSTTYALSLVNMKTTLNAPSGSLQYLTDYSSYIIELNLDPTVSTFYIVWADDEGMYNFTFLNSLGDNKNSQILADFTNPSRISSFIYAQVYSDSTYTSTLFIWIYKTTGITKYVLAQSEDDSENILDIAINKVFAVELDENLLINSAGPNFQVTTQIKCVCQNTQVTEMICFYGNDACTFTVQTSPVFCNPIVG